MRGENKTELTTEIGKKEYVVATVTQNGRRYASAGTKKRQAISRLNELLERVFGRESSIVFEESVEFVKADIASVYYIEWCYNGEKLTEDSLAIPDEEMATIREEEIWPSTWKEKVVKRLGH